MDIVGDETDTDHAKNAESSHNLGDTGGVETAAGFVLSLVGCDVARWVGIIREVNIAPCPGL